MGNPKVERIFEGKLILQAETNAGRVPNPACVARNGCVAPCLRCSEPSQIGGLFFLLDSFYDFGGGKGFVGIN